MTDKVKPYVRAHQRDDHDRPGLRRLVQVVGDAKRTTAMLDRLRDHYRSVETGNEIYRLNSLRSRSRSAARSRTSHSQTSITRQPSICKSILLRASRLTFASNFAAQNSGRVLGIAANPQPCLCQKQPCTKMTA